MATVYDFHPAAKLFPMMDETSFAALKADIQEHGLRESLVFWKNKLIDGRNRQRACEELGIEPGESELDADQDPVAYIISANLHRRHLTISQRAMIAAKLAGLKNGQHEGAVSNDTACSLPIGKAAELLNVSRPSVTRALEVLRTDDKKTIAAVEAGKLTVGKATAPPHVLQVDRQADGKQKLRPADPTPQAITEVLVAAVADIKRIATEVVRATPKASIATRARWGELLLFIEIDAMKARECVEHGIRQPIEVGKKAGPKHRPTPSGRGRRNPRKPFSAESDEKAELFPIERHDDGWVVVMPNGEITYPFLSKQAATQQAVRCRQIAQDDPEFLRIHTRKTDE